VDTRSSAARVRESVYTTIDRHDDAVDEVNRLNREHAGRATFGIAETRIWNLSAHHRHVRTADRFLIVKREAAS